MEKRPFFMSNAKGLQRPQQPTGFLLRAVLVLPTHPLCLVEHMPLGLRRRTAWQARKCAFDEDARTRPERHYR